MQVNETSCGFPLEIVMKSGVEGRDQPPPPDPHAVKVVSNFRDTGEAVAPVGQLERWRTSLQLRFRRCAPG